MKLFYWIQLALRGEKLMGYKGNTVIGYDINEGTFKFWSANKTGIVKYATTCYSRDEAEFKYKILMGGK